jgi:hypothetical protein
MEILKELDTLHRHTEINFEVSTFWDGPIVFKIGDEINGFIEQGHFEKLENGIKWLIEKLKRRSYGKCTGKTTTPDSGGGG